MATKHTCYVLLCVVCRIANCQTGNSTITAADPVALTATLDHAWQQHNDAGLQSLQARRFRQAEHDFTEAITVAENFRRDDVRLAASLNSLGLALRELGRLAEAEKVLRRAIQILRGCTEPACVPALASTIRNLSIAFLQMNRLFTAEQMLQESFRLCGPTSECKDIGVNALDELAWLEMYRNRPAIAEKYARQGLSLLSPKLYDRRFTLLSTIAAACFATGRSAEGERALSEAQSVAAEAKLDVHLVIQNYLVQAAHRVARSDFVSAEALVSSAMQLMPPDQGNPPLATAYASLIRGRIATAQGIHDAAEAHLRKAEQVFSIHLAADHPDLLVAKADRAALLRKLKRGKEAKLIEKEIAAVKREGTIDPGAYAVDFRDLQDKR